MLNPRLIIKKCTFRYDVQIGGKKVVQGSYFYFIYIYYKLLSNSSEHFLSSFVKRHSIVALCIFLDDSTILIELRLNSKPYVPNTSCML